MHIVFQQADINTLAKSFDLDESLRDEIIEIKDDYAVGPLKIIYSDEGMEERKQKLSANKDEHAWIWVAPNKHDVSGYYWLMTQLKDFVGRIFILSLNNLPFIN